MNGAIGAGHINLGPRVAGIRATVTKAAGYKVIDGSLTFGAVGNNETVRSTDTIVLRGQRKSGHAKPVISWKVEMGQNGLPAPTATAAIQPPTMPSLRSTC